LVCPQYRLSSPWPRDAAAQTEEGAPATQDTAKELCLCFMHTTDMKHFNHILYKKTTETVVQHRDNIIRKRNTTTQSACFSVTFHYRGTSNVVRQDKVHNWHISPAIKTVFIATKKEKQKAEKLTRDI